MSKEKETVWKYKPAIPIVRVEWHNDEDFSWTEDPWEMWQTIAELKKEDGEYNGCKVEIEYEPVSEGFVLRIFL